MYVVRHWSVRHARGLEIFYDAFEWLLVALHPLWKRIGYARLEAPFALLERAVKGLLFDCQMCGQCALSSTGMSCSMNCPKNLRNGPCGGVREGGFCDDLFVDGQPLPDLPPPRSPVWTSPDASGPKDHAARGESGRSGSRCR